ncbi:MAG: CoA-binding protein [bacterium]
MPELARLAHLLRQSDDPENPDPEALRELLSHVRVVAVVGLSREPTKAARRVPSYLAAKGFDVIPVNPFADRILGRTARAHLDQVPEAVDLVLVFRPSDEAGQVVMDAVERPEEPAIWLQEGILAPEATRKAREAGRTVVQDLCIFKVHRSLAENRPEPPPSRHPASSGD